MVYLELFHGRHYPDEELDEWGFEGPVLGPFEYVHTTYNSNIKVDDEYFIDSLCIDKDGFVLFKGGYYGDMSVFSNPNPQMRKRIKETQRVFKTDPALLITDERDWVKLYCVWRLKNDSNTKQPRSVGQSQRRPGTRRRKNT